jgi:hypothetical protein
VPRDYRGVILKSDKLEVVKGNNFEQRFYQHVGGSVTITARANSIGRSQERFIAVSVRL